MRRLITEFIEVKYMKFIVFLFLLMLFTSCSKNVPQNIEISSIPSPTLTKPEKAERQKINEKLQEELEEIIKDDSKKARLSDLKNLNLSNNDLEIRVWRDFGAAFSKSIFILKRSNEKWSAYLIKKADKESAKGESLNITKLNEPKSSWENVWQKFIAEEILTLPNGLEVGTEPYPDNWSLTVESKVNGIYRAYNYAEGFEEIREARQMAKIVAIIAEEFNLKDFKPTK